jgi:hypothetical protein
MAQCNLCGATSFVTFKGREGEQCGKCGSLRRHRVAYEVYRRTGLLTNRASPPLGTRVLHLAPEGILYKRIASVIGTGYLAGDARPEAYRGIQCLKLILPQGFDLFPDNFFDYVIHNHVLEHIPGSYKEHVSAVTRILKPGGMHVFSIPGPGMKRETEEGGEHLSSDAERLEKFGQIDHVKVFGKDLPQYLDSLEGGHFSFDDLSIEDRAQLNVPPTSSRFLIWRKAGSPSQLRERRSLTRAARRVASRLRNAFTSAG